MDSDARPVKFSDAIGDARLTPNERRILAYIERHTPPGGDCFRASRTIAAAVDCCLKTVERALRRFAGWGWIVRVWDFGLRTRRRLRLLWRAASDGVHVIGQSSGDRTEQCPISRPVPPDPPIEGPEGTGRGDDEDGPSSSSGSTPAQKHGPGEAEALAKAREVFGPKVTRSRVAEQAKKHGWAWVSEALDVAREKARRVKGPLPWGFVVGVLGNFRREGGPPPAAKPVPAPARIAEDAAMEARRDRRRAAEGQARAREIRRSLGYNF